jgi:rubrerythrin
MTKIDPQVVLTRRNFLHGTGLAVLSASAVSLLAGCDAIPAAHAKAESQDVNILNVALGLEHEAIGAYQLGAESGLLEKPVLDVAVLFQSQHKQHRDALIAAVRKLGGTPVESRPLAEYAKALQADTLKNQTDVLMLAARLELGATNAYLGVIPSFKDTTLARVSGRLAADETMHWTVLNNALGRQLPQAALTFGA